MLNHAVQARLILVRDAVDVSCAVVIVIVIAIVVIVIVVIVTVIVSVVTFISLLLQSDMWFYAKRCGRSGFTVIHDEATCIGKTCSCLLLDDVPCEKHDWSLLLLLLWLLLPLLLQLLLQLLLLLLFFWVVDGGGSVGGGSCGSGGGAAFVADCLLTVCPCIRVSTAEASGITTKVVVLALGFYFPGISIRATTLARPNQQQ